MNFGQAIEELKAGYRVARAGWNGKSMWLALSGDGVRNIPASSFWSPLNAEYAREQGGSAKVLPCITMKTAGGEILMGWLASQTDMLAEDWMRVPTPAEVPVRDPGCANPAEKKFELPSRFQIGETVVYDHRSAGLGGDDPSFTGTIEEIRFTAGGVSYRIGDRLVDDVDVRHTCEVFSTEVWNSFVVVERGHDPETIAYYAQTQGEAETTKARVERDTGKEFRIFSRVRAASAAL